MTMRIIACFAASLDGKISLPKADSYVRISSDEDIRRLKSLRDEVDAVLVGGSTFRAYPGVHRGIKSETRLLHGILTRSLAHLPPEAPLFQTDLPVVVFTPEVPSPALKARYPDTLHCVTLPPVGASATETVACILHALAERGVQSLLVEGGGEVMALFLQAQALQELYLTLCPLLIGGCQTPSLVSGSGFSLPPHTEILSLEQREEELFLRLKLHYPR